MTTPVIRAAGQPDAPAITALRRAWTAEQHGPVDDPGFGARFLDWYAHGYVRVVLSPAERAVPFYRRAGFTSDTGLLVRRRGEAVV